MKATDEATHKQNQFSWCGHTEDGGSSEEPKIAPGVAVRLTDAPRQVTGNPNAQTIPTQ